ncbi:MAG TPA: SiaB family protein kinase [Salinivirgaceae bacterium]|nr:SiaB family protein kinase [Salinivirgaceae bacterium]
MKYFSYLSRNFCLGMELQLNTQFIKDIEGEIVFSFQGEINSNDVTDILDSLEIKLGDINLDAKTKKRVFYVVVELVQNLYHHSCPIYLNGGTNKEVRLSSFVVAVNDDFLSIITGNFVNEKKISETARRIDSINSCTKEELKNHYKQVLTNQVFSDKGGGGLGMIDVARKADGKLKYGFELYKNNMVFFQLQVNININ